MSDFVRRPLEKRLNRQNIMTRLARVERAAVTASPTQRVDQLKDISSATGDVLQDKERVYVITDSGEERDLGEGNPVPYYRLVPACTDCLNDENSSFSPYTLAVLTASGTVGGVAGEAGHPGIVRISSIAAGNSGGRLALGGNASTILLEGGEVYDCIFRPLSFATQVNYFFGFMDSVAGAAAVTDGVYMTAVGDGVTYATMSFAVMNAGVSSGSGSGSGSLALTTTQWYRLRIEIKDDASEVSFYVYTDAGSGSVLWHEYTIVGGIPTTAGGETSVAAKAYRTNSSATPLLEVDRMDFFSLRRYDRF